MVETLRDGAAGALLGYCVQMPVVELPKLVEKSAQCSVPGQPEAPVRGQNLRQVLVSGMHSEPGAQRALGEQG